MTSDLGLVLDGIVVTLSEFERSHWASQLITIPFRHDQSVDVRFTAVSGLLFAGTVEVVMFNCPDWSIGARVITITGGVNEEIRTFGSVSGFPTSCNRLVHVCIPVFTNYESLIVSFEPFNDQPATNTMSWVHLAEVIFTGENCPTDLIVPGSSQSVHALTRVLYYRAVLYNYTNPGSLECRCPHFMANTIFLLKFQHSALILKFHNIFSNNNYTWSCSANEHAGYWKDCCIYCTASD